MTRLEKAKRNFEQIKINEQVKQANELMWKEYLAQEPLTGYSSWKKLRYCSAEVLSIDKYFILKSYDTIIACIDKETNIMYDFLRLVYGYTSTSAQHISKFWHDYGYGTRYTYRFYLR